MSDNKEIPDYLKEAAEKYTNEEWGYLKALTISDFISGATSPEAARYHQEPGEKDCPRCVDAEIRYNKNNNKEKVIIVWKDGTYKEVEKSSAWEFENDVNWLVTIVTHQHQSPVVERDELYSRDFIEWVGTNFYYEDETGLWEVMQEGTFYELNEKQCFRFTTSQLKTVYKSCLNE